MLQHQPDCPADVLDTAVQRCRVGFRCLVEALAYAADAGCDPRQFALDLSELQAAGIQPRDLRWLLKKGYAIPVQAKSGSTNRTGGRHTRREFDAADRFIATARGVAFWAEGHDTAAEADVQTVVAVIGPTGLVQPTGEILPHWDAERRELRVGNTVVKRFRQPSPLQELILTAFEEEGWPHRIADPLPRRAEQDPKRRLHDAVRSLNLNQRAAFLRFGGDGTGEGIVWEWTQAAEQPIDLGPRLRKAA